jgi:ribosomal protein L32
VIVNERRVAFFAKGKSKEPRRGSKRLQLIEKEERDSCPNAKRRHVVCSARSLLKGQVTSREMMHHLRSSLSDDDFVDVVSDDLPVVFRFNQAVDVLEEATP